MCEGAGQRSTTSLFWLAVAEYARGAAPLALAATSAFARDAVDCSDGGFFLRKGRVLVAVRRTPVSLPFQLGRQAAGQPVRELDYPASPTRPMVCVDIGGEEAGTCGAADPESDQEALDGLLVPRALAASTWWLKRRVRRWGMPMAVRCSDLLAPEVARRLLSQFRAGEVATLTVVVVPRNFEYNERIRDEEICHRQPGWVASPTPLSLCLGPEVVCGDNAAPWYDGLVELIVLAELHSVAGVCLQSREGGKVPLKAPALRRLLVQGASDVAWIGALGSLEELMVTRAGSVSAWGAIGELDSLRRLCISEAAVPKLGWLAGCASLEDVCLSHMRSVQDWQSLCLCPRLRRVQLWGCRCSSAPWMKKCKQLECVWLCASWRGTAPFSVSGAKALREYCSDLESTSISGLCKCEELDCLRLARITSPTNEDDLFTLPASLRTVSIASAVLMSSSARDEGPRGEAWFSRLSSLQELQVMFTPEPDGFAMADAGRSAAFALGCPSFGDTANLAAAQLPVSLRVLRLRAVNFSLDVAGVADSEAAEQTVVVRFLSEAANLEELFLHNCSGIEHLRGLCDTSQRLRVLSFTECELPEELTWLGKCTSQTLQDVSIRFGYHKGMKLNLNPLSRLRALKSFTFRSEYYYASYSAEHPGEPVEKWCPKADLNFLRGVAGTLESLVLELEDTGLVDESVLQSLPNLKKLHLRDMLLHSFTWARGCHRIEDLSLARRFEIEDWTPLEQLTQLRVLRVSSNSCDVLKCLRACTLLQKLEFFLRQAPHAEDFTESLAVLSSLPQLRFLDLERCTTVSCSVQRALSLPSISYCDS